MSKLRRPFSEEEILKLQSLYNSGVPFKDICKQLDRSHSALQNKLKSLKKGGMHFEMRKKEKTKGYEIPNVHWSLTTKW